MRRSLQLFIAAFLLCNCNANKDVSENSSKPDYHKTELLVSEDSLRRNIKLTGPLSPCDYDNPVSELGQGIVYIEYGNSNSDEAVVKIFNDSLLQDNYINWKYYLEEKPAKPVCPKYFSLDYGMLHFISLEKTDKAYKILINNNEIKYLPRTKEYHYKSWEDYITSSFGIHRPSRIENKNIPYQPIRIEPKEKADSIKLPDGFELLCPAEIKGDWVKVKYDCFYNSEDNEHEGEPCSNYIDECKNSLTGWLKWRDKNKILIGIYLRP